MNKQEYKNMLREQLKRLRALDFSDRPAIFKVASEKQNKKEIERIESELANV
jgi:hypothetical protein